MLKCNINLGVPREEWLVIELFDFKIVTYALPFSDKEGLSFAVELTNHIQVAGFKSCVAFPVSKLVFQCTKTDFRLTFRHLLPNVLAK